VLARRGLLPSPAPIIAQVEVFEDELAVTPGQQRTARAARYLATGGLWSGFSLDQLIKRTALGQVKKAKPLGLPPGMITAPATRFWLLKLVYS
jgi:hypothetical protein